MYQWYTTKGSARRAARRVLAGSTSSHFVIVKRPDSDWTTYRWRWRLPDKNDLPSALTLVRPKKRPV